MGINLRRGETDADGNCGWVEVVASTEDGDPKPELVTIVDFPQVVLSQASTFSVNIYPMKRAFISNLNSLYSKLESTWPRITPVSRIGRTYLCIEVCN
jgi:hypothetical protein